MGQYDWMYELRPIAIKEKVIEELAKHLGDALDDWPPKVHDWTQPADEARFAPLYENPVRPPDAVFRYACQLVRWELEREYERIDYVMRNGLWQEHAKNPTEYDAMQLIVRWLLDTLLAVREHSGQNLSRADLVEVSHRIERRIAPSPLLA